MKNRIKEATMLLCYGASVYSVSKYTGLGLRRTSVLLKDLIAGTQLPYTNSKGKTYRVFQPKGQTNG